MAVIYQIDLLVTRMMKDDNDGGRNGFYNIK